MDELTWTGKHNLGGLTPQQICTLIEEFLKKHTVEASMVMLNPNVLDQNVKLAIWITLHLTAVSDPKVSPNGFTIS